MITLNNNGMGFKSDWYIAKVIVEKVTEAGDQKFEFPCYRWVIDHLVVFEGKGTTLRCVFSSACDIIKLVKFC
jgi:hypothetical protein